MSEPVWSEAEGVNGDPLRDLLRETNVEREIREERERAEAQPTYAQEESGDPNQPEFIGGFLGGSLGGISSKGGSTYGTTGPPTYEPEKKDPGDLLRAFDERRDVAEAVAGLLGLMLGGECMWKPGGHSMRVLMDVEESFGRWSVRILDGWPKAAPRRSLALHEAFAFAWTRNCRRLGPAEAARWKWKMLVEARIVQRPRVDLADLPPSAPPSAVRVWREVGDLLAVRSLDNRDGSSSFPLNAGWLVGWSGGRLTESEVISGKRWLLRHGLLVRVGGVQGHRGGRPLDLWEVGDPDVGRLSDTGQGLGP